jgi:hypothetical protein
MSVQTRAGGLAFATRRQCNQQCDEHPHRTNMLQIKGGGNLIIERAAIPLQLLSLLSLPSSPLLSPLLLLLPLPSPSLSPALPVVVIVAKTINLSRFLISPLLFCTQKQVVAANAYTTRQKVMGWANQRLGKLPPGLPEDLRFCGFFGVLAEVSVTASDMMENHSVLPPTPKLFHFLWALAFMHTYPTNNTTLSSLVGGSNPKTISKYVWPFIRSIFALN